ncbi:MAG: aldehyde dehydrogenase family protein, partial [Myxococcota bacterium]
IELPRLTESAVDDIIQAPRFGLRNVPLHEIVTFLHNVGQNWKSHEYARRRLYIRYLVRHFGYSQKMAETEANWIALYLSSHYRLYDILSAELGSWRVLDGWVSHEESSIRATPRGRSFHLVPGNVPLSSVASIVRALITKNTCVVKVSSDDPLTPIVLGLSFIDTDANHPVTRAYSAVHWKGGEDDPLSRRLIADADVVCAWGDEKAVAWASTNMSTCAEIAKFGPKRSFAVVGADADPREAARVLAHDVAMYDQRACFSVQRVFAEKGLDPSFSEEVEQALNLYDDILPKGQQDFDEQAVWSLTQLQAEFSGAEIRTSPSRSWSIVRCTPEEAPEHPLGRVLFVHEVDDLSNVLGYAGPDVQTVAIYPYALGAKIRDACVEAGVDRIVELGMNNIFRVGSAHD